MTQIEKAKNAVASTKPQGIRELVMASTKELGKALPSHMNPERIVRIALTTLRTNPKLMDCNPHSFLAALFQSAQLGLEPNVEGQAYIIPYGTEANFQIGYKGYVELFYRHGMAVSLDAQEVCQNDEFDYQYGTESKLYHKPALKDRGEVIAYYAVAKLKDGAYLFKVMSKEDCMDHGKKHSKAFNSSSSPWQKEPDAMCKKTCVIQIMKLIPKSIEIQKAIAMDNTVKTKVSADMFEIKDETDWEAPESQEKPSAPVAGTMDVETTLDIKPEQSAPTGGWKASSSNSDPLVLKADIVVMLEKLGRTLLSYTQSEKYKGTDDVNALKSEIGAGKKKSQLMVQHSIIKKDYLAQQPELPEVNVEEDIDDSMAANPE